MKKDIHVWFPAGMLGNPKALAQERIVREALASIVDLREMGISRKGYRLAPPFSKMPPRAPRGGAEE